MGKVEVISKEHPFGHDTEISELLEDYPFLKNEDFKDVAYMNTNDWEIIIRCYDSTIVWKRNTMTGVWAERVTIR